MEDKKRNILFSEDQISSRIKELGEIINREYKGRNLVGSEMCIRDRKKSLCFIIIKRKLCLCC